MELLTKIYIIQECKQIIGQSWQLLQKQLQLEFDCISPFFWRCTQADYGFNTQPGMEYRIADSELWNITSHHLETGGISSWKVKKTQWINLQKVWIHVDNYFGNVELKTHSTKRIFKMKRASYGNSMIKNSCY